jgi:hypothetical protein
VCIANAVGQVGRSTGVGAAVMARAAAAPIARGATPYERAVREALARGRSRSRAR